MPETTSVTSDSERGAALSRPADSSSCWAAARGAEGDTVLLLGAEGSPSVDEDIGWLTPCDHLSYGKFVSDRRRCSHDRTEGVRVAADRTVQSTWRGGWHCSVEAGRFTLEVDEPPSVGGTDLGPQPTDYFLVSIASCYTMALSHAARKRS